MIKRKVLGIGILSIILLVLLNFILFNFVLAEKVDLIEVIVANKDIHPRSEITSADLKIITVPRGYLDDLVVNDREKIIGRYTQIQGYIPEGSMFYQSMLFEKEELPDYPSLLLKEEQASFAISSDVLKTSGNTLATGQKVDLYVTVTRRDGPPIIDCLIQAVRITAIKDRNGISVDDPESSGVPYVVVVAVEKSQVEYLKSASKVGSIDIYGISTDYSNEEESIFNDKSIVIPFLK